MYRSIIQHAISTTDGAATLIWYYDGKHTWHWFTLQWKYYQGSKAKTAYRANISYAWNALNNTKLLERTRKSVWCLMQIVLHTYYNLYLYKTGVYTEHRGHNLCICKWSILADDSTKNTYVLANLMYWVLKLQIMLQNTHTLHTRLPCPSYYTSMWMAQNGFRNLTATAHCAGWVVMSQ